MVLAELSNSLYFSLLAGNLAGEKFARDCVHRQPVARFFSVPLVSMEIGNLPPNCRDLGMSVGVTVSGSCVKERKAAVFLSIQRKVHFGSNLQINLLARVGWSGGQALCPGMLSAVLSSLTSAHFRLRGANSQANSAARRRNSAY